MRWYKIIAAGMTFDATQDPNALNVELDIVVAAEHLPKSGSFARVWGISLQTLLNAKQYNNQPIYVYAGMQQGLPLANPAEQGLLTYGKIFPALGNWVGTDMTLDFYILADAGVPIVPKAANVIHNWPAGQPMSQAIKQTLTTAYPSYTPVINISPKLVLSYTDTGYYQSIGQYATYIFNISNSIMNSSSYHGVQMHFKNKQIIVNDGTVKGNSFTVNFQDLIGQPIWTGPITIQFKTVMRGDADVGMTAILPQSLATLTYASGTQSGGSASNVIQGNFTVTSIRHTGNFRQPDWPSWCSTFEARMAS